MAHFVFDSSCMVKDPVFLRTHLIYVRWVEVNLRHFSTIFGYIWRSVSTAGGTNCSWEWTSNLFLGVNQQTSASNRQLPLMGFEPQRRGVSSFKARRLNHSATAKWKKVLLNVQIQIYIWSIFILFAYIFRNLFKSHLFSRCKVYSVPFKRINDYNSKCRVQRYRI